MLEFRIGDRVGFQADGRGAAEGMLTRYNRRSVTVITDDGHHWNVAPALLSRATAPLRRRDAAPDPPRRGPPGEHSNLWGLVRLRQDPGSRGRRGPVPKLVWRVKLVAELEPGVTTETAVARIECGGEAGLADLGLRLEEVERLTAALQARIVPARVGVGSQMHRKVNNFKYLAWLAALGVFL